MLSKESLPVNAIAKKFDISRPAISKHLRILVESELVKQKKEGRERHYSFNPKPMTGVLDWLKFYSAFWDNKLRALKLYVESTK